MGAYRVMKPILKIDKALQALYRQIQRSQKMIGRKVTDHAAEYMKDLRADIAAQQDGYEAENDMYDERTKEMLDGMDKTFVKWKRQYKALPSAMRAAILGEEQGKPGGKLALAEATSSTKILAWYEELVKMNKNLQAFHARAMQSRRALAAKLRQASYNATKSPENPLLRLDEGISCCRKGCHIGCSIGKCSTKYSKVPRSVLFQNPAAFKLSSFCAGFLGPLALGKVPECGGGRERDAGLGARRGRQQSRRRRKRVRDSLPQRTGPGR